MRLFLLLLFVVAVSANDSLTEVGEKIRREQAELEKLTQRIEEGSRRLSNLKVQHQEIQDRVRRDRLELEKLKKEVSDTERQLSQSKDSVQISRQELAASQLRMQKFEASFYARLRYMYKNRNQPWYRILLSAQNIADLDRRLTYYERIVEADSGHFQELREEHRRMQQAQASLMENSKSSDLLSRKLQTQRESLLARIREDTSALQKVKEEQDTLEKRAEELARSSRYLTDRIQNLISTQEQIRSDRKSGAAIVRNTVSRPIARNSLLWPLASNYEIVKRYGNIGKNGATLFSPGIDLETQKEQNVLAAEDGVIFYRGAPAGANSSYGKVVMIAHGDFDGKFITLYGNLDNILVTLNQTIKRGEKIATISSSQTFSEVRPPKLHFQVRVNGEPKDPLIWLSTPK